MLSYALARHASALAQLETLLTKELGDEAGAFGSDLDTLVTRAYRSRISVTKFADAMEALLEHYIRAAYLEGLAEGGIEADEIDDADEKAIREMIRAQRTYVDGFAQAVMDAKAEDELRPQIDARVVYWAKSVRAAAVAGVNSAKANEVCIFSGESGEEDCATCHNLMGARHRRSWFVDRGLVPGIPGNDKFVCGGWNCSHVLAPVGAPLKR